MLKTEEKKKLRESLSSDEKSAADFLSWITKLRDDRKPLMNKLDVLLNESVRLLYKKWGIEQDLSFVSYAFEVLKGRDFLLNKLDDIKKKS